MLTWNIYRGEAISGEFAVDGGQKFLVLDALLRLSEDVAIQSEGWLEQLEPLKKVVERNIQWRIAMITEIYYKVQWQI